MAKELFNFLSNLDSIKQWFLLISFTFSIISFLFFFIWRGFKIKSFEFSGLKIDDKEKNIPKYLRSFIWQKEIKVKGSKIGTIGFIKDIVIFKFFGNRWNSSDPETKEALEVFENEFYPPIFLPEDTRKELESFIFLDNCNIQTKIIAKIKQRANNWNHIYVIANRTQIESQELDLLFEENGGPSNLTVIQSSRSII